MKSHEGLVALVTGAGLDASGKYGFGPAIAQGLSKAGATVAVSDIDPESTERIASVLREDGGEALAITMDVSNQPEVVRCYDEIEKQYGRCDIVVSNAGFFIAQNFCEISLDDWQKMISVNLTGSFLVSQEASRRMKRYGNGGVIVFISSDAAIKGAKVSSAAYTASKAGTNGLMKAVARDGQEAGIRSISICPTVGDTPGMEKVYHGEARTKMANDMFSGKFISPQEVALEVVHVSNPLM